MKSLMATAALFGIAALAVFGMSEPAPASAQPVISDDVRMVSEQMLTDIGPVAYGKNGRGKRGVGGRQGYGGH